MMLYFPADIRSTPMATVSMFTTELLTAPLPWLGPAFVPYSIGWMPMEVASADERRTYETTALDFALGVWLPSRSDESRVHHQETKLPRLFPMWARIRIFLGFDATCTVECCRQRLCTTRSGGTGRGPRDLSPL